MSSLARSICRFDFASSTRYSLNNLMVPTCFNPSESNTIITGLPQSLVTTNQPNVSRGSGYESSGTTFPDVLREARGDVERYFCFRPEEMESGSSSSRAKSSLMSVDKRV